jgi:hypothetical protein
MPQAVDNIVFRGRILWRDIATWIRLYLAAVSLQADPELEEEVANKLLNLPVEFGNMIRVFFSDKISDDYTVMLSNYIILLMNIIKAQSSGDINAVNKYTEQLYQNIEQRAEYLANINPFWDKNTLVNFMNYFTSMTIQEINAYLSKQYKESINIFDRILNFSSEMGDYVAQGITNYLIYSSRRPITL